MIVYDKLFIMIKAKGLSQNQVIRDLNLSVMFMSKLKIKNTMSNEYLNKFCKYFSCQPGDLMEYIPDDIYEKNKKEKKIKELEEQLNALKNS